MPMCPCCEQMAQPPHHPIRGWCCAQERSPWSWPVMTRPLRRRNADMVGATPGFVLVSERVGGGVAGDARPGLICWCSPASSFAMHTPDDGGHGGAARRAPRSPTRSYGRGLCMSRCGSGCGARHLRCGDRIGAGWPRRGHHLQNGRVGGVTRAAGPQQCCGRAARRVARRLRPGGRGSTPEPAQHAAEQADQSADHARVAQRAPPRAEPRAGSHSPVTQIRHAQHTGEGIRIVVGRISSGFGARLDAPHKGLDLAAPIGTPIRAPLRGAAINSGPASRTRTISRRASPDRLIPPVGSDKMPLRDDTHSVRCRPTHPCPSRRREWWAWLRTVTRHRFHGDPCAIRRRRAARWAGGSSRQRHGCRDGWLDH